MAKSTNISFARIFAILLIMMFIAETLPTPAVAVTVCNRIHGVEEAETCSSIVQRFSLDDAHFLEINPNINCVGIFVGQWVCTAGQVN